MRYRTKLLIAFLAFAFITNGISIAVMDRLALHFLYEGYRAKLLSITASIASMIDGDMVKQVQSPGDETSAAYGQLRETLRRARNANRRADTFVKRVFTVMKSKTDPKVLRVGIDAEESLTSAATPGEVYRADESVPMDISVLTVTDDYVTDEFGTFLRSHAPIRDHNGQVVGAVVVEASARRVDMKMFPIRISSLFTMLLAIILAVPAALILSRRTGRPLMELKAAADRIGAGDFETPLLIRSKDEFGSLAQSVNAMATGLKERDRVKRTFAHYVSHQVLESILKSGAEIKLSGDRRRISVLFCDIRGFSAISERLPPEQVVRLLNDYFEAMVEVVFRNNGTLDKFIGDGIMVIFGAPGDDPYQEERAMRTAIEMHQEMQRLSAKWEPEGIHIGIGVGINSGPAVVGNIGSSRRMDYTAIGDTVNLAARLESATRDAGVGILISEYTYTALRGTFRFKEMGAMHVRGRTEPVLTYTVEADEVMAGASHTG